MRLMSAGCISSDPLIHVECLMYKYEVISNQNIKLATDYLNDKTLRSNSTNMREILILSKVKVQIYWFHLIAWTELRKAAFISILSALLSVKIKNVCLAKYLGANSTYFNSQLKYQVKKVGKAFNSTNNKIIWSNFLWIRFREKTLEWVDMII